LNELQVVFQEASAKGFNEYSKGVFDQLSRCHTAKMGYHRLRCDDEVPKRAVPQLWQPTLSELWRTQTRTVDR
jgi:exonuclease I